MIASDLHSPYEQAMFEYDCAQRNWAFVPDGYMLKMRETVRLVMEQALQFPDASLSDWTMAALHFRFDHPGLAVIARRKAQQASWMLSEGVLVPDEVYFEVTFNENVENLEQQMSLS